MFESKHIELNRNHIIIIAVLSVLFLTVLFFYSKKDREKVEDEAGIVVATSTEEIIPVKKEFYHSVIGSSVDGLDIELYDFFSGDHLEGKEDVYVLFVGGIHGGYEWNTVLLAYEFIDHFKENRAFLPKNVSIGVIPSLNPDGVKNVIGTTTKRFLSDIVPPIEFTTHGRFNSNGVDLNRNFDCKWKPESSWRGETVSAGEYPFSEPEAKVMRDIVMEKDPVAVIFWHSAAGAVYGSECEEGILLETMNILNAYSSASSYPAIASFDHYEVTGDVEGWLASIGIASITVELTTHQNLEWERNKAGVEAVLNYFGEN